MVLSPMINDYCIQHTIIDFKLDLRSKQGLPQPYSSQGHMQRRSCSDKIMISNMEISAANKLKEEDISRRIDNTYNTLFETGGTLLNSVCLPSLINIIGPCLSLHNDIFHQHFRHRFYEFISVPKVGLQQVMDNHNLLRMRMKVQVQYSATL